MCKRFVLIPIITSLALAGTPAKISSAVKMEESGHLQLISDLNKI